MKLVSFYLDGREGYGAVKDGGIVDLSGAMFQETAFCKPEECFCCWRWTFGIAEGNSR